jgi:hypothetical protein
MYRLLYIFDARYSRSPGNLYSTSRIYVMPRAQLKKQREVDIRKEEEKDEVEEE